MILIKPILAYLFGDFILQLNSWVAGEECHKPGSLFSRILIHYVLSLIFLWDIKFWWVAVLVGIVYFILDAVKINFQNVKTKRVWFFIDELLHVLVIAGVYFCYIFIKTLLSFRLLFLDSPDNIHVGSLLWIGKYIGILGCLLVFTFIIVNYWGGAGFMVAAISVFRFSYFTWAKEINLQKYVLMVTKLSFEPGA